MQLLTPNDETRIREILDKLARLYHLQTECKEVMFLDGMSIDRLWTVDLPSSRKGIPVVGFEIEKGIPLNERLRKDIMNIVCCRSPLGYIIIPHKRIMEADESSSKSVTWYKNGTFYRDFQNYCKSFANIDIRLVDADDILENEQTILAKKKFIPYLNDDDFRRD
jgi:hypothetical protein